MAIRERNVPKKFKGRKIYSISRLSSFENCQYGYHLNYNLKKDGVQNIYAHLGTKVHDMLELMQFGKLKNEDALNQFRMAVFESTTVLGYKFPSDKVRDNFISCIEHFLTNYSPIPAKEFRSELEFFTEIEGHVLVGYIDGVILTNDGTIEVIDYKTSSKYTKQNLDEHGMQLVLYAMALEQEFGAKVEKVKWNMLKYCCVSWQGATKPRQSFCQRNEVVKAIRNEIKKDLRALGKNESEIELILDTAQAKNDMSMLPETIQNKYSISDGFVEYTLNDETREILRTFVRNTVAEIEGKNPNNDLDWKPKEISKNNSFFCSVLCDHKSNCYAYKEYMESLEVGSEFAISVDGQSDNKDNDILKQLFG